MATVAAPIDATSTAAWKALEAHQEKLEAEGIDLKAWFAADAGAKVRNRSCGCIRKVYGVGERSHRVEVELEGSVDLWEVRMLV